MNINMKCVLLIPSMGFVVALPCMAGPITPTVAVIPPPVVVAPTPVAFPPNYWWDGFQFVGMVGNQVYYLGPGNVWTPMDPVHLGHWQTWQRTNPNWRNRSIPNTRYRTMARPGARGRTGTVHPQPPSPNVITPNDAVRPGRPGQPPQ